MAVVGPIELVCQVAEILGEVGVPYALGGSLASSLAGEPRSTVDVDLAIRLGGTQGEELLDRVGARFYVPVEVAREAIQRQSSFNAVDTSSALKVDFFVTGDGLLDRMQMQRRTLVAVPGAPNGIWVTSPEDQVLRKLDWFQQGGSTSERQWRDVVGILRVQADSLDVDYLRVTAAEVSLGGLLAEAIAQVE